MNESELERFINDHKIKLQSERDQLSRQAGPILSDDFDRHAPGPGWNLLKENVPPVNPRPAHQQQRHPLNQEPDNRSVLQIGDHETQQNRLREERAKEYQQFIAQNRFRNPGPTMSYPSEEDQSGATLKFKDRTSAARRLREERNREYNSFLQNLQQKELNNKQRRSEVGGHPSQPAQRVLPLPEPERRGGANQESYDDLMRRKREEESRYRRYNDEDPDSTYLKGLRPMKLNDMNYGRSAQSDSYLNRNYAADDEMMKRMGQLDSEVESRKVRFREEAKRDYPEFIEDRKTLMSPGPYQKGDMFLNDGLYSNFASSGRRRSLESADGARPSVRFQSDSEKKRIARSKSANINGIMSNLTGGEESAADKHRKQEDYRRALESQIRATEEARRVERYNDLRINITGEKDLTRVPDSVRNTEPDIKSPTIQTPFALHTQEPHRPPGSRLSNNYSNTFPPPAVQGNTNTATALDRPMFAQTDYNVPYSKVYDGSYQFYSGKDPTDTSMMHIGQVQDQIDAGLKTSTYRNDLMDQMREKEARKAQLRDEQNRFDRSKQHEIFDPWGKGGGGAPLKDADGNIIADLRELHHIVSTNQQTNPTYQGQLTEVTSPRASQGVQSQMSKPSPYARGNVFNDNAPSNQQKQAQDTYKQFLERQIEEKKQIKDNEKHKQQLEQEEEEKRIEAERLKMQRAYEEEQQRLREKDEEQRRKQEETKRNAEEKRHEAERKRRDEDDRRHQEQQSKLDREREERVKREREVKSPPIPTLRKKEDDPQPSQRSQKTTHKQESSRTTTKKKDAAPHTAQKIHKRPEEEHRPEERAEINRQLSAMRKQLKSEQRRIEQRLLNKEYESKDRPPRKPREDAERPYNADFIISDPALVKKMNDARTKPWDVVPQNDPNPEALNDFNRLKYRRPSPDEEMKNFPKDFDGVPQTSDALEAQQMAYIREQEREIQRLMDDNAQVLDQDDLAFIRDTPDMKSRPLKSESAYLGVNGEVHIPDTLPLLLGRKPLTGDKKTPAEHPSGKERVRHPPTNELMVTPMSSAPPTRLTTPDDSIRASKLRTEDYLPQTPVYFNRISATPSSINTPKLPSTPFKADHEPMSFPHHTHNQPSDTRPPGKVRDQPDNLSLESVKSFNVDAVAAKNRERLRRLKSLTGDDTSLGDPDDVLQRFMEQNKHTRPPSENSVDSEAWLRVNGDS